MLGRIIEYPCFIEMNHLLRVLLTKIKFKNRRQRPVGKLDNIRQTLWLYLKPSNECINLMNFPFGQIGGFSIRLKFYIQLPRRFGRRDKQDTSCRSL